MLTKDYIQKLETETTWKGLKDLQFTPFNVLFPYYAWWGGTMRLAHLVLLDQEGSVLVEVGNGYSCPRHQPPIQREELRLAMFEMRQHFTATPNTVTYATYPTALTLAHITGERGWLEQTAWYDLSKILQDYYKWHTYTGIDDARRRMDYTRPNPKTGDRDQLHDAYGYGMLLLAMTNRLLTVRY